jgi:hypothetical protein
MCGLGLPFPNPFDAFSQFNQAGRDNCLANQKEASANQHFANAAGDFSVGDYRDGYREERRGERDLAQAGAYRADANYHEARGMADLAGFGGVPFGPPFYPCAY